MDEKIIKEKLSRLYDLQSCLKTDESGNYIGKDAENFTESIEISEDILDLFGLPYSSEFYKLVSIGINPFAVGDKFYNSFKDPQKILNDKIQELHKAAKEYLLSNPLSDVELLKKAKENNLSAFDILPELKINTHVYTTFIYDIVFLEQNEPIKDVLYELNLVNNKLEIYDELGRLYSLIYENKLLSKKENELIKIVVELFEKMGLKYIRKYVNECQEGFFNFSMSINKI